MDNWTLKTFPLSIIRLIPILLRSSPGKSPILDQSSLPASSSLSPCHHDDDNESTCMGSSIPLEKGPWHLMKAKISDDDDACWQHHPMMTVHVDDDKVDGSVCHHGGGWQKALTHAYAHITMGEQLRRAQCAWIHENDVHNFGVVLLLLLLLCSHYPFTIIIIMMMDSGSTTMTSG
jgi:hypothetical protein